MTRLPGRELYRAPRVAPALLAGAPLVGCVGTVTLLAVLSVLPDGRGAVGTALLGVGLIAVVVLVLGALGRPLFVVTTHGVGIRNHLVMHWYPWSDVRRVEVERHRRSSRGQVLLRLVDGTTAASRATHPGLSLLRGEGMPSMDLERSVPLGHAVDAHRAWLARQRPSVP